MRKKLCVTELEESIVWKWRISNLRRILSFQTINETRLISAAFICEFSRYCNVGCLENDYIENCSIGLSTWEWIGEWVILGRLMINTIIIWNDRTELREALIMYHVQNNNQGKHWRWRWDKMRRDRWNHWRESWNTKLCPKLYIFLHRKYNEVREMRVDGCLWVLILRKY